MKKTAIQLNIERLSEELKIYTHKLFNCEDELREAYKCKIHCIECEIVINKKLLTTERENIEEACNETQRQSVMMANNVLKIMGHPALFGFDKNHASNYYLNTYGNGE